MRFSNLDLAVDLAVYIAGCLLFYWGIKILSDAHKELILNTEYQELLQKQKMMSPVAFMAWIFPIAVGYMLIDKVPEYVFEIFLAIMFYFVAMLGLSYLFGVRKVVEKGYPSSYVSKYRISQVLCRAGILMIIGIQAVRFIQKFG